MSQIKPSAGNEIEAYCRALDTPHHVAAIRPPSFGDRLRQRRGNEALPADDRTALAR